MLNLLLLTQEKNNITEIVSNDDAQPDCVLFAHDSISKRWFVAIVTRLFCFSGTQQIWSTSLSSTACRLHFSADLESLAAALSIGRLCVLDPDGKPVSDRFVDDGIIAAEWRPDDEVVLFITQQGHLLLYQSDEWEEVKNVDTMPKLEENEVSLENSTASISWRGDGKYVAVYIGNAQRYLLTVHDGANLEAIAVVDLNSHLTHFIAWQPNGRHLYAISKESELEQRMRLFESNGLEHGSFDLQCRDSVQSVCWNLDSQFLTIACSSPESCRVQIWKRSNWQWYLKYEQRWEVQRGTICAEWDVEMPLKLHVVLHSKAVLSYVTLVFSLNTTVSSKGTAAVIDGNRLCMTPFRHVTIPPPLAAVDVVFPDPIQSAAFCSDCTAERISVLLASNSIGVVVCSAGEDCWHDCDQIQCLGDGDTNWTIAQSPIPSSSHLLWINDQIIAVFGPDAYTAKTTTVVTARLVQEDGRLCVQWSEAMSLNFELVTTIATENDILYLQSTDGCVYTGPVTNLRSTQLNAELSFPVGCASTLLGRCSDEVMVLGLTASGNLYRGKSLLTEKVTSMIKHADDNASEFLIFTTRDDMLHIRRFTNLSSDEALLANGYKKEDMPHPARRSGATAGMNLAMTPAQIHLKSTSFFERPIEQGARLIASPPGDVKVIFQMPRGNLETVSLRLFVVQTIVRALSKLEFDVAWELARMHRVDLNVLVDFHGPQFLSNAEKFIKAIPSSDSICELMTALQQGSVFTAGSAYCACLPTNESREPDEIGPDKVTRVCTALRTAMCTIDEAAYCKAIAYSYARCDPPDLENALMCIKAARINEIQSSDADHVAEESSSSVAGDALKHLLLYIDVVDLYKVALGRYDLSLAYMVVTHAQRDPGEALAELEQLSRVEPLSYRCAVIDRQLHRHSQALGHLVAAGPEYLNEAIDLAAENALFHELVSQIDSQDERRRRVLNHYGHWLRTKGMQNDAGAAFVAAGELQSALDAYQSCGDWEMTFILAKQLRLPEDEIREIALEMVEELRSMERFADAAKICTEYLSDAEEAVTLWTQARKWKEAVKQSHRFQREDLIHTIITPAAAQTATLLIDEFTEQTTNIKKYADRLKEVRQKRRAMETAVGHTGTGVAVDGEEIASTVAGLSIYTERTQIAKSKDGSTSAWTVGGRRPKKKLSKKAKKLKIKQGSTEEEAALLAHLQQELKPTDAVLVDVSALCEFLILTQYLDDARTVQAALDKLVKTHRTEMSEIDVSPLEKGPGGNEDVRWKWDVLRGC